MPPLSPDHFFGLDTHLPIVAWVILPLLIFLARTIDVSLATLRIVAIAQGRVGMAAVGGFFESLLWLIIVSQALQHLDNPLCVIGYAAGYSFGNVVGLALERRLAMGHRLVRVIIPGDDPGHVIGDLRGLGHGVTVITGEGLRGPVQILFTVAKRKEVQSMIELFRDRYPKAFFAIEDVRQAHEGYFAVPPTRRSKILSWRRWLRTRQTA